MTKQRAALFCAGGFFHSPINLLYKSELDKKEEQNEVWNQSEYLNICKVCNLGEKMTLKFWWKAKSDNDKKIQRESNGNWPVEAATAALAPDYYCDLISRGGGMVLGWIVKQATASVLHTFAILFPGLTIVLLWASEQ